VSVADQLDAALRALKLLLPLGVFVLGISLSVAAYYAVVVKIAWRRTYGLVFMFAGFGGTIGLFLGSSATPIISALLPPIITLIAGYAAYLTNKELTAEVRSLVPGAMIAFQACLLFGFWYIDYFLGHATLG
jgi:hypothetical protein